MFSTQQEYDDCMLERFGIPAIDLAPGKVLKVAGQGHDLLVHWRDYFVLMAAAGMVGQIQLTVSKAPTALDAPWEIIYTGPWVQQYYDFIRQTDWPVTVSMEDKEEEFDGQDNASGPAV